MQDDKKNNKNEISPAEKLVEIEREYDKEKYKLNIQEILVKPLTSNTTLHNQQNKVNNLKQQLQTSLNKMKSTLTEAMQDSTGADAIQSIADTFKDTLESIVKNHKSNKNGKKINSLLEPEVLDTITKVIKHITENNKKLRERLDKWEKLKPFLEEELKKPEHQGKTFDELLNTAYKDKTFPLDNLLEKAIALANATKLSREIPHITITEKGINDIEYPLDKLNANVWTLLKDAEQTGQLVFAAEKRGSKQPADIIYSINFDEIENEVVVTKKLTAFDKRCYIATSALFNNGFNLITVAQIYVAMGNSGRPSATDIKKINESLTKMRAAHIYINNESENSLYPKYNKFVYDSSLLPMERISAVVNGQTVDGAIHLFREPPLTTFAKDRKQITTLSRQLLQSPLSKTDINLQIDDYLIERISHIKKSKGKLSSKLLYKTIFEKTNIKTRNQKMRGKEKISKYLTHYKKCNFIKSFRTESDGVTISY